MAGLNLSDFDFSGVQTSGASQGDGGKLALRGNQLGQTHLTIQELWVLV